MTVETNANFISDLNKAYPRNRDLIKEGDDHLRLIKAVLQNTFPGIDRAVVPTAEKLNKIDASFVYEEDSLKINNKLTLKEGSGLNVNNGIVSNVSDPKEDTDAVNLRYLRGAGTWPIGSIYMSVDPRNPADIFGFGEWSAFARGRVILGSGTSSDINNVSQTFLNEAQGGEYVHKITETELPKHTHEVKGEIKEDGNHNHPFPAGGGSSASGGRRALSIDTGVNGSHDWEGERSGGKPAVSSNGKHTHEMELTVDSTGGEESMNNLQPYIVCNIWKRTK